MSTEQPRRGIGWLIATAVLAVLVIILVGVIVFGWFEDFIVFGTFSYVVDRFVDTGASPYLVKGILVIVLVPFFLALRELGRVPLFTPVGVMPKRIAWGTVIAYVSAFFLTMHFASRDQYFRHIGKKAEAVKYFALTPEGVRFFDSPGIDPKYGIVLRPVTPALMINLEKMKLGQVPKSLAFRSLSEITFFDPLTGDAKVWYHRGPSGQLELFSTGGFHPVYSVELQPVTADVITELERQLRERAESEERNQAAREEAVRAEAARRAHAEKQEAEEKVQAAHRARVERYLNTAVVNQKAATEAAVVLLPWVQDGTSLIEETLVNSLRKQGVEPVAALFKPAFYKEGRADALFAGDWGVAAETGLGERVDSVIIGRSRISFAPTGQVEGLLTASLTLDLRCLQVVAKRSCGTRSISAKGAGYGEQAALGVAITNTRAEVDSYVTALRR